jgi:biotin carboxyl carrier protein
MDRKPFLAHFSLEVLINGQLEKITSKPAGDGLQLFLGSQQVEADLARVSENVYSLLFNGRSYQAVICDAAQLLEIIVGGSYFEAVVVDPKRFRGHESSSANLMGPSRVAAPMPGKIVRVLVAAGDAVKEGQGVVVIEAMKMQNELKATKAGTIEEIRVVENQTVEGGESLLVIR